MKTPQKFRKKPVVIEAIQFETNNSLLMDAIVDWINGSKGDHKKKGLIANNISREAWHNSADIFIDTLEGRMKASVGDWIIKGVEGEFYPCKPDIFEKTYEPFKSTK